MSQNSKPKAKIDFRSEIQRFGNLNGRDCMSDRRDHDFLPAHNVESLVKLARTLEQHAS